MADLNLNVHVIKRSRAKFAVTAKTRKDAENIIVGKLRFGKLVWEDADSEEVTVICFFEDNGVWRPRRRFFLNQDPFEVDFPQS
jgi:hypothetical protein